MTTIRAFIKSHPVISYFALTFAISWGGMLPIMVAGGAGGIPMVAWVAGPPVAAILLTGLLYGREGFRDLLSRMTGRRVHARWYAVALLTAPLYMTAIPLAFSLGSPDFLPRILVTSDKAALLLFGLEWGLIGGGLLEELGWTGFAVPTLLRQRYDVLGTGLIVGPLWAALHFLVFFWMGRPSEGLPLALFVPLDLLIVVAGMTAYRVLMVWVYDRSGGSLLVGGMLMHASYTASTFILGPLVGPLGISGVAFLTLNFAGAVVLWVVVGVVALANHGHLTRQQQLRGRVA